MKRNKNIAFGSYPNTLEEKSSNRDFIDSLFKKDKPHNNQEHFNSTDFYYTITKCPLGKISK